MLFTTSYWKFSTQMVLKHCCVSFEKKWKFCFVSLSTATSAGAQYPVIVREGKQRRLRQISLPLHYLLQGDNDNFIIFKYKSLNIVTIRNVEDKATKLVSRLWGQGK